MVIENPLPVSGTCWSFLCMSADVAVVDRIPWERVRRSPNFEERKMAQCLQCTCAGDPQTLCLIHPCKFQVCRKGPSADCPWRRKAPEFVMQRRLVWGCEGRCLTYTQVLEMHGWESAIQCSRAQRAQHHGPLSGVTAVDLHGRDL